MPNPMKTLFASVLVAGVAVSAHAQDADTVVATVGGTEITLGHMIVMTSQLPPEYQNLRDETLYNAVLDQLVKQEAVGQSLNGELSKASILALENERRAFFASEALNRAAEAAVTEDAIKAAYDEQYGNVEPAKEFNANHILVETEEEAKELVEALNGGADFEELAKEKSTGPSGPSGGALGWFGVGMMVKPFEDAVLSLEPGQISGPVQTQFGWHVVKLNEVRDQAAPTLDEVRAEIAGALQQEAVTNAIEELGAEVEVSMTESTIDPALLRNIELIAD